MGTPAVYQPGQAVTLAITLVGDNGLPVAPTALAYDVLDENENVVEASQALALPNAPTTSVNVTVPAALNMLATGALTGFRTVVLSVTTAAGTFQAAQGYVLRARPQLVVLQNSFQTYGAAQMRVSQMLALANWPNVADADRINAMADAFTRMTRFGYFVRWPRNPDAQNVITWLDAPMNVITPTFWPLMSVEILETYYPTVFLEALCKAQILEADYRLNPSQADAMRQAGIQSQKTGETTTAFRQGKPLDIGLCKAALRQLTGYIDIRQTIGRC